MKQRSKFATISLTVVLAISSSYAFWWLLVRPPGPDEIARMAATALAKKDTTALVRLTLPEEQRNLNLTPYSVGAVLNDTLYKKGSIGRFAIRRVSDYPVDEPAYVLVPLDRHDLPGRLVVRASQQPNGHWYLELGYLLLVAYGATHQFQDAMVRHDAYIHEASQYGIRGIRRNETGYQYFGYAPQNLGQKL